MRFRNTRGDVDLDLGSHPGNFKLYLMFGLSVVYSIFWHSDDDIAAY